jgi:hypothetical protein
MAVTIIEDVVLYSGMRGLRFLSGDTVPGPDFDINLGSQPFRVGTSLLQRIPHKYLKNTEIKSRYGTRLKSTPG